MLGSVANVNLPTPVVLAGAGLCLLGGYLIGVLVGPEGPDRATGVVESYDSNTRKLCLTGDSVEDQDGAEESNTRMARWVGQHLGTLVSHPPDVSGGQVLLHTGR